MTARLTGRADAKAGHSDPAIPNGRVVAQRIKATLGLEANKALFAIARPNSEDKAVKERCAAITDADYTRLPVFEEREKLQKEEFKLPLFPTTTIGSFPQSADVRANRTAFKKGEKTKEEYIAF